MHVLSFISHVLDLRMIGAIFLRFGKESSILFKPVPLNLGGAISPLNLGGGVSETPRFTVFSGGRPLILGCQNCRHPKFRGYGLTGFGDWE